MYKGYSRVGTLTPILMLLTVMASSCKQETKDSSLSSGGASSVTTPQEVKTLAKLDQNECESEKEKELEESVKGTVTRYWSGDGSSYCGMTSLSHRQIYHLRIDHLVKEGRLQEAIWILFENGSHEALEEAKQLEAKLARILEEGNYKTVPKKLAGTTKKALLDFGGGIYGIFKYSSGNPESHWWSNEKAEVGAYVLSTLLRLNVVPMTLIREIEGGERGTIQYFFSEAVPGKLIHAAARNFARLKVLDFLTSNVDRKTENYLYWPEQDWVIGIDNGAGFVDHQCGSSEEIRKFMEEVPDVKAAIMMLHEHDIEKELGPYVNNKILAGLIAKIHQIVPDWNLGQEHDRVKRDPSSSSKVKKK
jgi:hypothetical protein